MLLNWTSHFSIDISDKLKSLFWPCVFLKYVFTLFSAENERSTDAVEYGMIFNAIFAKITV